MGIPESQLDTWSHPGAGVGSRDTYAAVTRALEAGQYASTNYTIFLQGSYGNNTNIYAESDVDVVIRLDSIYHYDITALNAQELAAFNSARLPGTYPYADYKAHVVTALQRGFGAANVIPDKNAVKIKANGNRRSADVVVATDFHRYYSGLFGLQAERGICFFTSTGDRIVNYPEQHSANCTAKHQATNGWFKPMVRILKNMRSKLVDDGAIAAGSAPSYFLEGLLFNVPDDKFGNSYGDTFVAAINWIFQANRDSFHCANKQNDLVRDSAATSWPCSNCAAFLDAIVKLWNDWK
jgi:hypothetical protein